MIRIIVKKISLYLKGMKGNSTHLGFPGLTYQNVKPITIHYQVLQIKTSNKEFYFSILS